jgi:hypothetical protein
MLHKARLSHHNEARPRQHTLAPILCPSIRPVDGAGLFLHLQPIYSPPTVFRESIAPGSNSPTNKQESQRSQNWNVRSSAACSKGCIFFACPLTPLFYFLFLTRQLVNSAISLSLTLACFMLVSFASTLMLISLYRLLSPIMILLRTPSLPSLPPSPHHINVAVANIQDPVAYFFYAQSSS